MGSNTPPVIHTINHTVKPTTRHAVKRSHALALVIPAVALALLALGILGLIAEGPRPASAAAPPVDQCNGEFNVGGEGIACTVTVINYVDGFGILGTAIASSVTVTRCVGAAGPVAAGAGTCTTTTTTSAEPVLQVTQCNGSGNGGGGVVICTATITNHFSGAPQSPVGPARIYQCIGSVITGPGAPGTCTPVNTPGVTSVAAATVGQCNGSGNGGTNVGFLCTTAAGSTTTTTVPINIDQCNSSGNGGGALVTCTASVTNVVTPVPPTPVPTAIATPTPTVAPTATATVAPTATPTATPTASPTPTATPPAAPPPANTGSGGPGATAGTSHTAVWLAGIAAAGLALASAGWLARRRSIEVSRRIE
jgi:hypothetical protein